MRKEDHFAWADYRRHSKMGNNMKAFFDVVGATGFEPATPWSRTKCATRLRYAP